MQSAKEEVTTLLNKLPDNCSLEDIQYHLYVIEKIKRGIEAVESGDTLSHNEVEKRLKKWQLK